MSRRFRLEEAERLLPELAAALREAIELKARFQQAENELRQATAHIALVGGASVNPKQLLARRGRRDALAARLKELIAGIESHGCLVKDLDIGLIDFPTWFNGREVFMCWRLGEPAIQFWHEKDEGYRGRKPIDDEFRLAHRGERPS
ncbi:MAG: DUF2203 domain-containing protein [Bryobacterales bacterium]|nr:DUF2203 domain-containing protein [Bryobacteraceae bacterium]MDW8131586.1 DUF2203 domain-containing protein [Bryobacterales bacterium]